MLSGKLRKPEDADMPKTDYADPEIKFPRFHVRIQKREQDAYWLTVWLYKEPGEKREMILNGKRAGSFADAHELVGKLALEFGAAVGADDIDVDWPEKERG
jgi:hypothetical protein